MSKHELERAFTTDMVATPGVMIEKANYTHVEEPIEKSRRTEWKKNKGRSSLTDPNLIRELIPPTRTCLTAGYDFAGQPFSSSDE